MLKQTRGLLTGARWLLPASALWMFGCPNEELAPIEPCTVSGVSQKVTTQGADEVDLLFMIDNSGSMAQEQDALAVQLPLLAQILASGELPRPDGSIRKFTPVRSLHLGVISSDIGLSGAPNERPVTSCEDPVGDDGKLLVVPAAGCNLTTVGNPPNHLDFVKEMTDPTKLGEDFGCITKLGTEGCGLEQQLESMLKAVTPSTSTIKFSGATSGHADGANNGFLRPNSVVALVAVTDEEDCSVPDSANQIFTAATTDTRFIAPQNNRPVGLNSRCAVYGDPSKGILHPAQRYIDGFRAVRPANPDLVIFGAIAGVPVSAETMVNAEGVQDFDAILGLDAMQNKFNDIPGLTDANAEQLTAVNAPLPDPACVNGTGTSASPARRFVEVAKGFGSNGVIRSICAESFASALTAIIDKIASKLTGACLDRTLNPNNQGIVECDIVEYLPVGKTLADCDPAKGRTPAENPMRIGDDKMPHAVCKINQVAVAKNKAGCSLPAEDATTCLEPNPLPGNNPGLVGWYYDDFTEEVQATCGGEDMKGGQRIGFTVNHEPGNGSQVRFECLQPVFTVVGKPKGKDSVNKSCDGTQTEGVSLENLSTAPDNADCQDDDQYKVVCESFTNTCQILCASDANCPDAWVCERREGNLGFCVNPTCPN